MNIYDSGESKMMGAPLFKFAEDTNIQKLQDELIEGKSRSFAMEEELERERTSKRDKKNKNSYNALILNTFPPLEEYAPPMDASIYSSPNLSYKQRRSEYKKWKKQHAVYVSQYGEFALKPKEEEKKRDEESYEKLGILEVKRDNKDVKEQRLVDYKDVKEQRLFMNKEWREEWANTKMGDSNLTRREIIEMVGKGDYSNFENLDDTMRNMFAKEALDRLVKKYELPFEKEKTATLYKELAEDMKAHKWEENDDASDVMNRYFNERVGKHRTENICADMLKEGGVTALLDPALRLGLSLAQKSSDFTYTKEQKNWFRELDEQMSAAVMLETLKQKDENQLKSEIAKELIEKQKMNEQKALKSAQGMVEADKAQKIQTAKRLLLMHLGSFYQVDGEEEEERFSKWNKPVAVALSHCSRVTLELPKCPEKKNGQREYKEMWDSIFYQEGKSNLAQDNRRAASTHSIEIRSNTFGGREKKVAFNLIGQRGMNVAIGGLGNQGVSGKMILNDGSCGHFYSMYKEGDTEHYGAILMGLESDSPGMTNQLGHTHDVRATAEKASSLGGQRDDEVGKKYGGRRCVLTNEPPWSITRYMNLLEKAMKKNALGMDAMKMLVGPPMEEKDLSKFLRLIHSAAYQG